MSWLDSLWAPRSGPILIPRAPMPTPSPIPQTPAVDLYAGNGGYISLASRSVVFDANGRGAITLGPERARERWHITRIAVQATGDLVPECRIYRGAESPSALIDGTATGNFDISETNLQLQSSEHITAIWSDGSPNGIGTIVVEGERR
jgi:hypothetical protein